MILQFSRFLKHITSLLPHHSLILLPEILDMQLDRETWIDEILLHTLTLHIILFIY